MTPCATKRRSYLASNRRESIFRKPPTIIAIVAVVSHLVATTPI
jgi:hypothetical protein